MAGLLAIALLTGCGDGGGPPSGECSGEVTPIHEIQGAGARSPKEGQRHRVEAVVTARFPGRQGLSGFFLQEEPEDEDGDPATSEGIFVFEGNDPIEVSVGDRIQLSADVVEWETHGATLTELSDPAALVKCGAGPEIRARRLDLSAEARRDWEALEGMRVTLEGVVTDTRDWARFGSVVLAHEQLRQPTQVVTPGAEARARREADDRSRIILDDGSATTSPNLAMRLRSGDGLRVMAGIVDHRFGAHRIQPSEAILFGDRNPRPVAPPPLVGDLRVAAFNVLNWFDTLDDGTPRCGPERNQECRGAKREVERSLQRAKLGAALRGLSADLIGLMEIENGNDAALAALRAELGGDYRAIETGSIGTDVIRVALLYRRERLQPVGDFALLDQNVDPEFEDRRHRPVLAQTFETPEGERFSVAVNHWKSKGSECPGDPDRGDGQGRCNETRAAAASSLLRWLATDPTASGDPDVLVLGDLNSYRLEDPVRILVDGGYQDLLERFEGPDSYTSTFDGRFGALDHALASPTLATQVSGAAVWHINADEPTDLAGIELGAFGSSDHDPVLVTLDLGGS